VFANHEAALLGNPRLSALDLGIVEFLDATAVDTHQVIVVLAGAQLEHRLAGLEVVALKQAGLLELGQHAVDGGQADVQVFGEQQPVDILGRKMAHLGPLEESEDLEARNGGFQPHALEVFGVAHRAYLVRLRREGFQL
jgi:hypothetical protein